MRKVMVLALCLSLAAGFALANEFTVSRVDNVMQLDGLRSDDADCYVGNEDAYWGIGWTEGNDNRSYGYKLSMMGHPMVCECPEGLWALRNIDWIFNMLAGMPQEFRVALHTDTGSGPGAELYSSQVYSFEAETAGYWGISFPFTDLTGDDCTQVVIPNSQYLVVHILTGGAVSHWVIGFDGILENTNYIDHHTGDGWQDLYLWIGDPAEYGNLSIMAEVDCCQNGNDPVQTEESSLSGIKQLFR